MSEGSPMDAAVDAEELEAYRLRARAWLAETMPRLPEGQDNWQLTQEDEMAVRARRLQRLLFDGGFAGITYPVEYGGLGLSPAHQRAFTEESAGYEMPLLFNVPTLGILAPTLLDFGTEEQKQRHLPAILRGDDVGTVVAVICYLLARAIGFDRSRSLDDASASRMVVPV